MPPEAFMPAWSYTSLTAFETCPRRFFHVRVAKDVPDPPTDALTWGNTVHEALEKRLKGQAPLPDLLQNFEPYAAKLESLPGTLVAEQEVALTEDMQPTHWFDRDVWVRGKFDIIVDQDKRVVIGDWKTGGRKPDNDQLKLFAALASVVYPKAQQFKTLFIWLKEKKTDQATYSKEDIPKIWEHFMRRVQKYNAAHAAQTFPPKPSGLCRRYCPVRQCEFCGR